MLATGAPVEFAGSAGFLLWTRCGSDPAASTLLSEFKALRLRSRCGCHMLAPSVKLDLTEASGVGLFPCSHVEFTLESGVAELGFTVSLLRRCCSCSHTLESILESGVAELQIQVFLPCCLCGSRMLAFSVACGAAAFASILVFSLAARAEYPRCLRPCKCPDSAPACRCGANNGGMRCSGLSGSLGGGGGVGGGEDSSESQRVSTNSSEEPSMPASSGVASTSSKRSMTSGLKEASCCSSGPVRSCDRDTCR